MNFVEIPLFAPVLFSFHSSFFTSLAIRFFTLHFSLFHSSLFTQKPRVQGFFRAVDKVYEDVVTLAVGYDNRYAALLNLSGGRVFRYHAASAMRAFRCLDIAAKVAVGINLSYEFTVWIVGVAGVDAVDVAQQYQHIGIKHHGY